MFTPRLRTALTLAIAAVTATALGGCTGSSMSPGGSAKPADDTVTIGLVTPATGPYLPIGPDMTAGWNLYLSQHGGKLGGHPVKVVAADEGDGGAVARASVDKLLTAEHVDVIVGGASADTITTMSGPARQAHVPLIGVGGRPSTIGDISYFWSTSFLSTDFGKAGGATIHQATTGPVYVMGPDYVGGHDEIGGFTQAFQNAGGTLANPGHTPAWTPWPATMNFTPWLTKAHGSHADAMYAFYAGAPAVAFVKQHAQVAKDLPLYGPAFLTEGGALAAEGTAAAGIYTVADYSPDLTNPANVAYVKALSAATPSAHPNLYNVTAYDAAALLDQAIRRAGEHPDGAAINTALAAVGSLNSPRGTWRMAAATHSPIQPWYLRQVKLVQGVPSNVVVKPLATIGG